MTRSSYRRRFDAAIEEGLINRPPDVPTPPNCMLPVGASIYTKTDDGARWDKYKTEDLERERSVEALVKAMLKPVKGIAKPVKRIETKSSSDVFTEYVITDMHIGMYAWAAETGNDYDVEIACEKMAHAMDRLVSATPTSDECLINQMGDFFHMDSEGNETTKGTRVDVDTRYDKVIEAGIDTMRHVIHRCLEKHETVRIRNTPGNHDKHSSRTLDWALKGYFHNEPRVVIEDARRTLWAYTFGKNIVGITHGDKTKMKDMAGTLACDYREEWGQATHSFCRCGHVHHSNVIDRQTVGEFHGVKTESFRTLSGKDFYHDSNAYRGVPEATSIVLKKEGGELERHFHGG